MLFEEFISSAHITTGATYISFSSLQSGSSSKTDNGLAAESVRLFSLRSSSLKSECLDLSAEDTTVQPSPVTPQLDSLYKKTIVTYKQNFS